MKVKTIANIFLLLSAFTVLSCVTSNMEYDRMNGTAFPNDDTDSAGNTESLGTIYASGGHLLTVDEDQTNIAPLSGPSDPADPDQYDYITSAELQTLAIANRSIAVNADTSINSSGHEIRRYYLWGIVADHFVEFSDGTRDESIMGWMYDPVNRSAFANFFKHPTNSINDLYLRSVAHEIGHAFNLSHGDGDGSTTIMNQTSVIDPTTFLYEFSSSSLDHLQNHVKTAVYPGIGPRHYDVPHVH